MLMPKTMSDKMLSLPLLNHSQYKCTPLHKACSRGNVEIVLQLFERGANISARDHVKRRNSFFVVMIFLFESC